jgi:GNAT superfamily N-acetyltransferase
VSAQVANLPSWARSYVFSTWLNSYVRGATEFAPERIGRHDAFQLQHKRIEDLLASEPIALAILDPDAPSWIGGYLVAAARPNTLALHYVYVRSGFKQRGLGSALLAEALRRAGDPEQLVCTHWLERWRKQAEALGMRQVALTREVRHRALEVA